MTKDALRTWFAPLLEFDPFIPQGVKFDCNGDRYFTLLLKNLKGRAYARSSSQIAVLFRANGPNTNGEELGTPSQDASECYLKNTLEHELGHLFGLSDTYRKKGGIQMDQPQSAMACANGVFKDDDRYGLYSLYASSFASRVKIQNPRNLPRIKITNKIRAKTAGQMENRCFYAQYLRVFDAIKSLSRTELDAFAEQYGQYTGLIFEIIFKGDSSLKLGIETNETFRITADNKQLPSNSDGNYEPADAHNSIHSESYDVSCTIVRSDKIHSSILAAIKPKVASLANQAYYKDLQIMYTNAQELAQQKKSLEESLLITRPTTEAQFDEHLAGYSRARLIQRELSFDFMKGLNHALSGHSLQKAITQGDITRWSNDFGAGAASGYMLDDTLPPLIMGRWRNETDKALSIVARTEKSEVVLEFIKDNNSLKTLKFDLSLGGAMLARCANLILRPKNRLFHDQKMTLAFYPCVSNGQLSMDGLYVSEIQNIDSLAQFENILKYKKQ
jgi:hypothetical protein